MEWLPEDELALERCMQAAVDRKLPPNARAAAWREAYALAARRRRVRLAAAQPAVTLPVPDPAEA